MSIAADSRTPRTHVVVPRPDLSLDFANTLAWRGSEPTESIHSIDELLGWLVSSNATTESAAGELSSWFSTRAAQAATAIGVALELREVIYRLLRSAASKAPPAREDLRRLNSALGDAGSRQILERADGGLGWRVEAKPTAAGILAPVLWSAADILVDADAARVRQCANERCLWLFRDDSKNGTRRWCSMQSCGNRAKAHRHYLRQKAQ
jgi:predicted RNA-binding Zn ribbon-like protein